MWYKRFGQIYPNLKDMYVSLKSFLASPEAPKDVVLIFFSSFNKAKRRLQVVKTLDSKGKTL